MRAAARRAAPGTIGRIVTFGKGKMKARSGYKAYRSADPIGQKAQQQPGPGIKRQERGCETANDRRQQD
ncbi:hypothetical protein [Aliiroseovarius sp.]|uniref:hypothetical protein n=1 Tax=Aliiroseovarius sp. TaxID=1872442 RepID=UPI003BA889B2